MNKRIRKILRWMCFVLLFTVSFTRKVDAKEIQRVINVVYDDSGSMIRMNGKTVDTWCQAKYSMEVFAAMLGENDTMNIYVMSDYMSNKNAKPKLTLSGKKGLKTNVKKVHKMITRAQDTPFRSVEKAYEDLVKKDADEKWLVVLTDGEFDEFIKEKDKGKSKIDDYFSNKEEDIKLIFFGMGANAAEITANEEENIYYEKAKNSKEILTKVTQISTRIYNSDRLDVDTASKKISFDVPMSQLIVFAQGAKVKINNIKSKDGTKFKSSETETVKYSEKAATNYDDVKVDKNLAGKVATFTGDFTAGEYTIDVDGAETIEVYYKPNVEIAAYLKNADGEEVTNIESLEAGEYTIEFGFIKAGTNEIVPESKLLGNVTYVADVTNNGKKHDKQYSSGDKIRLEEGNLKIDATASFLDYNTVSTSLEYNIYKNKQVTFSVESDPDYLIFRKGMTTDEKNQKECNPIVIRLTLDGSPFTDEEWAALETPKVTLGDQVREDEKGFFASLDFLDFFRKFNSVDELKVEKATEPGVINIYPSIQKNDPESGTYVSSNYSMKVYSQVGKAVWTGEMNSKVKVLDKRSILEREAGTLIRIGITIGFVILLLGFTPLIKKRFPKTMKKNPTIICKPIPYGRTDSAHGRFTKDTMTVFLPFVPEQGTLRFVPSGTVGVPNMKLKAAGGSKMTIMNTAAFAGRNNITIDGMYIPETPNGSNGRTKLLQKSPNMMIDVKTDTMKYSCVPRN